MSPDLGRAAGLIRELGESSLVARVEQEAGDAAAALLRQYGDLLAGRNIQSGAGRLAGVESKLVAVSADGKEGAQLLSEQSPDGLYGRVVRTKRETPLRLADQDDRGFVMVMDSSGLQQIARLSGFKALIKLGFSSEDIARKIAAGNKYKLVVFGKPSALAEGTWDGVVETAARHYPQFGTAIRKALPTLRATPLARFEEEAGFDFARVHAKGESDPRFMTVDRFATSEMTPTNIRRFLFDELHLNELYSGDGKTYSQAGEEGVREYIMPNAAIDTLPSVRITDLSVSPEEIAKHELSSGLQKQ